MNKAYASSSNGVELSATSAWLDTFTATGPANSLVHMKFTFAIDGNANFVDGSAWNATHFNFQIFALRGDNWTMNGLGSTTYANWYSPHVAGDDYDELFFQRVVPANVTQVSARNPETGAFNYTPNASQQAGAFGSNVSYDGALDVYVVKTVNPGNGLITTISLYSDRRVVQVGANPPSTLFYNTPGNQAAVTAAAQRANLVANYSILDVASFCGFDPIAGENQCGNGAYDGSVTVEFDILSGTQFALAGLMVIDELDGGIIDFYNTAKLSGIEANVVGDPSKTVTLSSQALGSLGSNKGGFSYPSIAAPGVPEPASWAMMIGGLGLVGAMMRRRRSAIAFA